MDLTHSPEAKSWLPEDPDFPVQSLPLGRFCRDGANGLGMAIGSHVVDLSEGARAGLWHAPGLLEADLNLLAAQPGAAGALRQTLFAHLTTADSTLRHMPALLPERRDCQMLVPFSVGDYTDFYASIHHATRVGSMFRPENPLLPNYRWVPIGYHGRSSTIVASGTAVVRPHGQLKSGEEPTFALSQELDYELELGFWVGPGNQPGRPIPVSEAGQHIFGVSLLNDWSARDVQRWEYQPLGPFLAKSFATSVSPWVVTSEALLPFRCSPEPHECLAYLDDPADRQLGMWDVTVEARLSTEAMRAQGLQAELISRANLRELFWTPAQLLAHHASNGCWMRPGDLLGSGTISGPAPDSGGCLLERTWVGSGIARRPLTLPSGESRLFLADGDEVSLTGFCERNGYRRISLGDCRGKIGPA